MDLEPAPRPHATLLVATGWTVATLGMAALALGWWADLAVARGGSGEAITRPTTALVLALCGLALTLAVDHGRRAAALTTLAALLVSAQSVFQHVRQPGLDAWLGATPQDAGSVGLFTTVPVVALAVAAWALLGRRRHWTLLAEVAGLAVAAISSTLALSWVLAIIEGVAVPTATSPLTSGLLLFVAMGWLRRAAEDGVLLGPLVLDSAAALSMRRVLGWLVGIVVVLVVLVRLGPRGGPLTDPSVRTAITTTVVFGAMLLVVARVAHHLERAQGDVRRANRALQRSNRELEHRVAKRTAQLERRTHELQRSNEELDHFASVASHDLQEPLRMVSAYTQLLDRTYGDQLDDDARELMGFALDGAGRMQTLIDDLLEYSRLHTRAGEHAPVDLDQVVATVVDGLRLQVEEAGARVTIGPLPPVVGDPARLQMLFHNLLSNALKYRDDADPWVAVEAEALGDEVLVRVADNGIGVPPARREQIFEPLRRLHSRARYPGSGIGLAICRRVVEQHGGRIWVDPGATGGAVFCLTLRPPPATGDARPREA